MAMTKHRATPEQTTVPAVIGRDPAPISRDVIKEIALDIGKEVASHIEVMYPKAVEATSKTMLLSVRNCVYNEIMAALEDIDEAAILRRLEERKRFRRQHRATYRKLRDQPVTEDVLHDS
jgi:hypothetical protein